MRSSTESRTCSATVRPKRASQADGIMSRFRIVPTASPSAIVARVGLLNLSVRVSPSSSWSSSSTGTVTVFAVSPRSNVSWPETAV